MIELPSDLPIVERNVVRLVVRDVLGLVLLFHTRDVTLPELGTWWELPGGGIDDGETYVDTAIRELREETGIHIGPTHVGPAGWRRSASFRYRHTRRLQHEVVALVQLGTVRPEIDEGLRLEYELEDYFGYRWWPVADILASTERFYPGRLPTHLPELLAGKVIEEPFELWS